MMRFKTLIVLGFTVGGMNAAWGMEAFTRGVQPLREAPDPEAAVLMELMPAVAVDMQTCSDGWCRVEVNGTTGWLPEDVLRLRGVAP